MIDENVWCGVLEAGDKSTPIVRDHGLDTGNPSTVYLFNLKRGMILEYRRDIVESRLRELTDDESDLAQELRDAFVAVRSSFSPRRMRTASPPPRAARIVEEPEEPEEELEEEPPFPFGDDDDEDEEEPDSDGED
jgi:hypothetical protein